MFLYTARHLNAKAAAIHTPSGSEPDRATLEVGSNLTSFRLTLAARAVILVLALWGGSATAADLRAGDSAVPLAERLGQLPLGFEPNQGQAPVGVQYVSNGPDASISLKSSGASLRLFRPSDQITSELGLTLFAGNPAAEAHSEQLLPGFNHSYFIGNDPSKWIRSLPEYAKVHYTGVWSGIDVVYYGNGRQLEYDFVVSPGASPSAIALKFSGMNSFALDTPAIFTWSPARGTSSKRLPEFTRILAGTDEKCPGISLLPVTGSSVSPLPATIIHGLS